MSVFDLFFIREGYSWKKINLLGIIHYLNICVLYDSFREGMYGKFLFLYGKYLLSKFIKQEKEYIL